MRDREFINRFCAFQILRLEDYRDMDDFLASCLKKMNSEPALLLPLSEQGLSPRVRGSRHSAYSE